MSEEWNDRPIKRFREDARRHATAVFSQVISFHNNQLQFRVRCALIRRGCGWISFSGSTFSYFPDDVQRDLRCVACTITARAQRIPLMQNGGCRNTAANRKPSRQYRPTFVHKVLASQKIPLNSAFPADLGNSRHVAFIQMSLELRIRGKKEQRQMPVGTKKDAKRNEMAH